MSGGGDGDDDEGDGNDRCGMSKVFASKVEGDICLTLK